MSTTESAIYLLMVLDCLLLSVVLWYSGDNPIWAAIGLVLTPVFAALLVVALVADYVEGR